MPIEISVIIPVYNAEAYLEKAVESALQFPEVAEVLLIEDGSPDNALAICKRLAERHPRVKLFRHPGGGNRGAGASRNLGLQNASSPFIAFLDADDYYLPNRFDADKKIFAENPQADGVYNALGVHYYSQDAEKGYKDASMQELTTVTESVDSTQLFESFIYLRPGCGYFHIDGLTVKRSALEKMSAWFNPALRLHQDSEFLIRLTHTARLFPGETSIPTVHRGVHGENRITSVHRDSGERNLHQEKLWVSLYDWAREEQLPERYVRQIYRIRMLKKFQSYNYGRRWTAFIAHLLKDGMPPIGSPYSALVYQLLFGDTKASRLVLRAVLAAKRKLTSG